MNLASTLLHWPLRLIPDSAILPILSGPLRGTRWCVGSGRKAYWFGTYERHFQRLIADSLSSKSVFYDIGANVGFYSLLAAKRGATVLAFEPLPRNLAFLRQNIGLNSYNSVTIFPLAVSDTRGVRGFSDSREGGTAHLTDSGSISVMTDTLDSLVDSGLVRPTHLKIDIEGAELAALRGSERCIRVCRPDIFLAVHSLHLHQECSTLLTKWGYGIRVEAELTDGRADLLARANGR